MTPAIAAALTVVAEWAPCKREATTLGWDSSLIATMHLRAARELGKAAAHGLLDRAGFEVILRRWCRIQPGLKGGSADHLCWSFDTANAAEDADCDLAESRMTRAGPAAC